MKSHIFSSHLVHPLSFLPFVFYIFSYSSLSLFSFSACRPCFLPVHERGWSTCNGKQRALRGGKRWPERRREGKRRRGAGYGVERKMMQEEERAGRMRVCEMVSNGSVWYKRTNWSENIHAGYPSVTEMSGHVRFNEREKAGNYQKLGILSLYKSFLGAR